MQRYILFFYIQFINYISQFNTFKSLKRIIYTSENTSYIQMKHPHCVKKTSESIISKEKKQTYNQFMHSLLYTMLRFFIIIGNNLL